MKNSFLIFILVFITFNFKTLLGNEKEENFKPVIYKLRELGVDSSFIDKMINDYRTEFDSKYCKINVTGFLKKTDYSNHYNEYSVSKTVQFHQDNIDQLMKAEMKYNVPSEVISSVLWVETRHGNYTGNHHVVSVYLNLALANEEYYIKMNLKNLQENFSGDSDELIALEKKLLSRSRKKSNWAYDQLVALYKLDKIHPFDILEIKGSWAGAFGFSQFLPSSYLSWAVDGNNDNIINLFDMDDAIFSVANYLATNGWNDSEESHRKAVYHYNNSSDYVDAVLKLAEYVKLKTSEN